MREIYINTTANSEDYLVKILIKCLADYVAKEISEDLTKKDFMSSILMKLTI